MNADFHGMSFGEDTKFLRCQSCGEKVGVYRGDEPNPAVASVRCYECAAVEEAERITKEAAGK